MNSEIISIETSKKIAELEKENQKLSKDVDMWNRFYNEEFDKNNKAAELIKKGKYIAYDQWGNEYITLSEEDILELENILQGSDKE